MKRSTTRTKRGTRLRSLISSSFKKNSSNLWTRYAETSSRNKLISASTCSCHARRSRRFSGQTNSKSQRLPADRQPRQTVRQLAEAKARPDADRQSRKKGVVKAVQKGNTANSLLRGVHQVLTFEKVERCEFSTDQQERKRAILGSSLFGTNEIFAPIQSLKEELSKQDERL